MKNWIWALGLILGTAATAFGDEIPPREDIVLKEHVVGSGRRLPRSSAITA